MNNFFDRIANELKIITEEGNFRSLKKISDRRGKITEKDGKSLLNFSSNDYLGFCDDSKLQKEFYSALDSNPYKYSPGSSASRLLGGNFELYDKLENEIESLYQIDNRKALVFNSGYHANLGIIQALCKKGDLIISDKLNHASIIDGARLSEAEFIRYAHNDHVHLEKILSDNPDRNKLIITESVFSMDGDSADIAGLCELKKKYNAMLYLDEAHSFGVYGSNGGGMASELNLLSQIDILVATFGKAAGGVGAFIYAENNIIDYLINKCRSFIYSTALPVVSINWNLFALGEIMISQSRRNHLKHISNILRNRLNTAGLQTSGNSHIVPVFVGKSSDAVMFSSFLENESIAAFAVRPPTVPVGSSRLRLSLSSAFTVSEIEHAADKIIEAAGKIL
ncbi:MAG TPA: 8-amino-7-oxononanoate synthase [Spirochaetota bacterium]|nr:8-amino-7-oxononanoate synthase [Spirochaetota bacterium]HOR44116.1 8-amino-7-oxononanoate synthase [Spirochaetota bacterium]HPK57023.1 8-amino-7-oxononanoate synthase [Spirochaetota bacterium]HQE59741.1 8-amino-7-oxononanoate synthase [Spirochaetota bacterium]